MRLLMLFVALPILVVLVSLAFRWPRAEPWLVAVSLLLFIPVGGILLLVLTEGRGTPDETMPWLTLISLGLGALWWRFRRPRLRGKSAGQDDLPGARAPRRQTVARAEPRAESAPSPSAPPRSSKIFISYRRHDSGDVTGRIYDRLVQRFGKDHVFKDVDSIPLGVDFRDHLRRVVGSCQVLLAVMGDQWVGKGPAGAGSRLEDSRDYVRIEIESALERKIPVIPVLVRGADVPAVSELPSALEALAYRNGVAVRPDPDFHRDVDRLIAGLEAHLGAG